MYAHLLVPAALLTCMVATSAAAQGQILSREPPMGSLKPGQVVHVDDGTCGKGRVSRVTGGNHVKVGGTGRVTRSRTCVRRPR